jgi:uncharacterized protein (TIGR02099 family)
MKRLWRAIEVLAWGVFFACAALVLAVRFWVLPDIERYRSEIVAAISLGIGLPVKVNGIEAGWLGLRPQITLTDVRIYDAQGREALVLPSIHNVIAWRSLVERDLRLHRLQIGDGLRLAVRRDAAGELYVAGLKMSRGGGGTGGLGAVLGHGELVLQNAEIEWRDELRGAPPLVFSGLDLKVVSSEEAFSLGLKARTPPELGSSFELRARLQANPDPAGPSGRVYLEVGNTDLAAWRAWIDYPLNVRQGQGALRVWATLDKGALKQATADVALVDVRASLADELSPLELASVRGRVSGRPLADGVEVSGRGLALVMERGPEIPKTDFQIVWRPQGGGVVAASVVDLQAVRHLVESLPLPPQLTGVLDELAPTGQLADSRLEWTGPFDAPQRFSARVRFSDLAMRPRGTIPGFAGLAGTLEATQDRGKLSLSSTKCALEFPRVFPDPHIAFDSLAGDIDWERDRAGALAVRVASLSFANSHASGNLFGSYAWRGEGPGSLDLSAVLNRADGRHTAKYLPHPAIMGEKVREWVANGVLAAEANDVRVRVRGDLRQFPFVDPASGEFQVTARFDKGVLDYARGWPRIHDIAGELNFERDRMEITGRSGTVLGAHLSGVRVEIPSLRPGAHVLVSGNAEGPSAEFLNFVQATPLRDIAGSYVSDIRAAGQGKLRLKLDLALGEPEKPKLAAEYEFSGNDVTLLSWLPPVEGASGRLSFTESSFTVQDVRGKLMGGTLALGGGLRQGRGLEITARGDASFAATQKLFDHPLRKHVSGNLPYTVTVRGQDGLARVTFESPLRGLESALPPPLAKSAADTLPLRIDVNPAAGGERDRISVTLGALARGEVARRKQGGAWTVQRTSVWLTPERSQPIRLPERPGTLVYGSLPAFDLDRWRSLLGAGSSSQGGESAPVSVELKFGSLDAFGRRLSNVALRASGEAGGWSANVNADELAGDVSYRDGDGGRIVARLSHFSIPADKPGQALERRAPPRPSELPAIDLLADEFTFRGKPLGRVELVASPAGEDWRIEKATMANSDASLSGSGVWRAAPSRTSVQFELNAVDAGNFLGRVGYSSLVKGGRARMHGSLAWQGDPSTLDFPSLAGELQLNAEDGQFLEIEPGIGKLIGLMSLQALPRRVALDFRDVFSKGFQFDRINAAGHLESGVLGVKGLRMRGPAAEVEMTGEVDLANETEDLRVRVLPGLGDTAALGVALVNPVAGVAAAIAQRILKNPIGHIFAYDYSVTGTWSDPKVVKLLPAPIPEVLPQ